VYNVAEEIMHLEGGFRCIMDDNSGRRENGIINPQVRGEE
jgi:hypothetical protein